MERSYFKTACSVFVLGVAGLGLQSARAADQSATATDDQLTEIVVTAQHRREDIQQVPIAVAAFNAETAAKEGISDAFDLAAMVPGLEFNHQGSNSTPFLRGVGSPIGQPGFEPSVASYIDDVYIPAGGALVSNFNSIDRLEVEKGPQGTLFGRNATGGVVQVLTKDPTFQPSADVAMGWANYETWSGSLYASGGFTDTMAANIAVYGSDQLNTWGKSLVRGVPNPYRNYDFGARLKFLWNIDERSNALLALWHDTTYAGSAAYRAYANTLSGVGGTLVPALVVPGPPGFYDWNNSIKAFSLNSQDGLSIKVTHDFDWAQLVSISAGQRVTTYEDSLEVFGPIPALTYALRTKDTTWTQELRLLSREGSPITWIAGLFLLSDVAGDSPLSLYGPLILPITQYQTTGIQTSDSYSAFGQATVPIVNSDTHFTMGLRYTIDDKTLKAWQIINGANIPAPNGPQSKSWSKLTYRFALDHQFDRDLMGYIAYNRGYKSGVFNAVVQGAIQPAVAPEVLDSYTIGAKSELFDHKVRLNLEGFYYQYKNIQTQDIIQGVTQIVNAASATIKGIDLDIEAKPVKNLTLTASAEVMTGRYDSFPIGPFNTYDPVTGGNIVGSRNETNYRTIYTPPFSFSIAASYLIPTGNYGDFSLNASLSHTGNYFMQQDNGRGQLSIADDRQPVINLVNTSVNWLSENGAWGVDLWGKNITGEKYYAYSIEYNFGTAYSPAPPATFGLTLRYHFGP